MGLIKASRNFVLGKGSYALYNHAVKSAKANAFSDTGKEIEKAKKRGYRINGSAVYKKNLAKRLDKAKENKELRDKFISDL